MNGRRASGFSRRDFIRASLGIGAGLVGADLLAACGGTPQSSQSSASAVASGAATNAAAPATVKLAMWRGFGTITGWYLSQFGKDVGLDVQTTEFTGGGTAMLPALGTGDEDFSELAMVYVARAMDRGIDITVLSGSVAGGVAVVAREGINKLEDLKGKKVGSAAGSVPDVDLRVRLLKLGIDPEKDLTMTNIPTGNLAAALKQGQIDALSNPEEFASVAVAEGYGHRIYTPASDDPIGTLNAGLVVRTAFMKANPDVTKRVVDAWTKAQTFLVNDQTNNPDKFVDDVVKMTNANPSVIKVALSNVTLTPKIPLDVIDAYADALFQAKITSKNVAADLKSHINFNFLSQVTGKPQTYFSSR